MRTILILSVTTFSGFVLGQTDYVEGWLKDAANLSAVGALIGMGIFLLKVYIPARDRASAKQQEASTLASTEQQKAFTATLDKMADRHDVWEQVRHADHERLQETLRCMTQGCADTRAAILRIVETTSKGPKS